MTKTRELREDLAALSHEIWAHWMRYQFSVCHPELVHAEAEIDSLVIPYAKVKRWKRQMATPYAELSAEEKASDLEQADKILKLLLNVREGFQYSRELQEVEQWIANPNVDRTHGVGELVNRPLTLFLAWAKMLEIELL